MNTPSQFTDEQFTAGIIDFFNDVTKLPQDQRQLALDRVEKFARLVAEGNEEIAALDVKRQCGVLTGDEYYREALKIVDAA